MVRVKRALMTKKRHKKILKVWTVRINNAVRAEGSTYSKFINLLYKKKVTLNRKVLSNMAISHPEVFKKVVAFVIFFLRKILSILITYICKRS